MEVESKYRSESKFKLTSLFPTDASIISPLPVDRVSSDDWSPLIFTKHDTDLVGEKMETYGCFWATGNYSSY
jgi:hypothetical protein